MSLLPNRSNYFVFLWDQIVVWTFILNRSHLYFINLLVADYTYHTSIFLLCFPLMLSSELVWKLSKTTKLVKIGPLILLKKYSIVVHGKPRKHFYISLDVEGITYFPEFLLLLYQSFFDFTVSKIFYFWFYLFFSQQK